MRHRNRRDDRRAHPAASGPRGPRPRDGGADPRSSDERGTVPYDARAREGRTVLTQNVRDFMPIARAYAEHGEHHAGLIVTPQRSLREMLARALPLLSSRPAEDLRDAVLWL